MQHRIQHHLAQLMAEQGDLNLRLRFRRSTQGANAFALPDGSIILTDDMVHLSEHDDELLAVVAHEIGHIQHQHGLRSVIQGSMLSVAAMLISGDLSAAGDLVVAIPVLLMHLGYSRDFEREADDYAWASMHRHNVDTQHFVHLMQRLQARLCADQAIDLPAAEQAACQQPDWQRYLITHPGIQERIQRFAPGGLANVNQRSPRGNRF